MDSETVVNNLFIFIKNRLGTNNFTCKFEKDIIYNICKIVVEKYYLQKTTFINYKLYNKAEEFVSEYYKKKESNMLLLIQNGYDSLESDDEEETLSENQRFLPKQKEVPIIKFKIKK